MRIMAVTNAKYANVVADAEEQPEAALKVLKELAEDIRRKRWSVFLHA